MPVLKLYLCGFRYFSYIQKTYPKQVRNKPIGYMGNAICNKTDKNKILRAKSNKETNQVYSVLFLVLEGLKEISVYGSG